jgi:hypothetical protein
MNIQFYATITAGDEYPRYMDPRISYMCPASSWYRFKMKTPRLPDGAHTAADCGGFVASRIWGDYRYTPQQYVDWLNTFTPSWAATMDYCCEDEITAGKPGIIRERQQRTTEMSNHFYWNYRDVPWIWVCTIQGWNIEDYRSHAQELKPLLNLWRRHYQDNPVWRVGIGTLCNRASDHMIRAVIAAVRDVLPDMPLHLWGVKLSVMKSPVRLDNHVLSVDSAAWTSLTTKGRRYKSSGMSKRQHYYQVALPEYLAKVTAALNAPKQKGILL